MRYHHAVVIILAISLALTLSIADMSRAQTAQPASREKYWPTREWRSTSPESQGMDSETLAKAFDYIRQNRISIHSLLIVRNGNIVLDSYFYPFQQEQMHDIASVTKSVTSTLIGIAVGERKLSGLQQQVLALFPRRPVSNGSERKNRLTVENLLTMTSGLDCRFRPREITLSEMMQSKDWLQFMLNLPMAAEPGSKFEYCSGGMHLLSGIISQVTGASALEFARRELFQPLGIDDTIWPADPDGISYGWGDLHLQPRDMAKIGYLWLNRGRWQDRQIVPAEWLQAATEVHSRADWGADYGYGFWVYPDRTPPIYEGLGRGGQRISVVPAKNLVVVFTGGGFEPGDIGKIIGESLKSDESIPENATAASRLAAAILAAARPPAAQPVPAESRAASSVSGRTYTLESNPLGLQSFSLTFSGGNDAVVRLKFSDGRSEERPVSFDAVPRLSLGGRFGLPVALRGMWESDTTFVLEYDEVANINSYRFRLAFAGNNVNIELKEKTGLVETRFRGKTTSREPLRHPSPGVESCQNGSRL